MHVVYMYMKLCSVAFCSLNFVDDIDRNLIHTLTQYNIYRPPKHVYIKVVLMKVSLTSGCTCRSVIANELDNLGKNKNYN